MVGFSRGDVIMKSKPFAFVILKKFRNETCENCWEKLPLDAEYCCKGCGLVKYCSKNCLDEDHQQHHTECQILKSGSSELENLPDQLRLLLRLWLKSGSQEGLTYETSAGISRCWEDLMDHSSELKNDSAALIKHQYSLLKCSFNDAESNLPSEEEFRSIYGKILTNSFSLRTDRFARPEPFGTGVYLLPSVLDHSCVPNCTVVFRGRELYVVATEDIPKGHLPEVATISYVNSMDDLFTRQIQQRGIWYFQCKCSLCTDSSLDSGKHALVCSTCSHPCPLNVQSWEKPERCLHCKRSISSDHFKRYRELYQLVEKGEHPELSYQELCEWAVGEMEDLFSDRDILYVKTVHYVHTACVMSERWSAGLIYGERVLPNFNLYYGQNTGVVAGLLLRLGICYGEEGNDDMSTYYLEKADDIYRLIPGKEHPFYHQDFKKIFNTYITQ